MRSMEILQQDTNGHSTQTENMINTEDEEANYPLVDPPYLP